jgi:hypothetical protein
MLVIAQAMHMRNAIERYTAHNFSNYHQHEQSSENELQSVFITSVANGHGVGGFYKGFARKCEALCWKWKWLIEKVMG